MPHYACGIAWRLASYAICRLFIGATSPVASQKTNQVYFSGRRALLHNMSVAALKD